MSASAPTTPTASALSLHDARPFFEKALAYGVQHGLLSAAKLDAICTEAPKGMVQIARYFGNENLRPDLEQARLRIVNLVSLYLLESCGGELHLAAQSLRDHSLLSRSKGGSEMLKNLIAMPQNTHFAMHDREGFTEAQIPQLAKWSLQSHAQYQAELAVRQPIGQLIDAALWLAARFDLQADDLEEAGTDAEAVIRTGLLLHTLAPKAQQWPDTVAFEALIATLRKKTGPITLPLPAQFPAELREVVERVRASVLADLPRLRDPSQNLRILLRSPAFNGHYFWLEDPLAEIEHYHHSLDDEAHGHHQEVPPSSGSKTWQRVTQGQQDEHALLTLFLYLSVGAPKRYVPADKTLLTEKAAVALLRSIHQRGLHPEQALDFIRSHAPVLHQGTYCALWQSFVEESRRTLCGDHHGQRQEALALLRRECHIVG
ncbi:hypothetical protein [Giesbergeria anulus]|uniref:Uncharacterized protein n=1 Tax=Giesbergeria anulus TaxID=180197 RepID=A0A1H9F9R3_9BURK|nr:hypothetical protein [Giesbergeria anulus]SEQ34637.1 hypothetical protein SAMN02982919_00493 [Giesbergeria anulus]